MRLTELFLLLSGSAWVGASPISPAVEDVNIVARQSASQYWVANVEHQGAVPFGGDADYQVYRNVKDFGAVGTWLVSVVVCMN
jgi:glucan 1,3-beta-glucosidase